MSPHDMSVEDQLRQAIEEHVADVSAPPDAWAEIEAAAAVARRRAVSRRRALASLALAAAIVVGVATVAVVHGMTTNKVVVKPESRGTHASTTSPATSATTGPRPSTTAPTTLAPTPTSAPAKGAVAPLTSATTPPTTLPPPVAFPYQPMWPFRTQEEAIAWQADGASGGHQPWHLDAGQTALSFTQGYLGFTEINTVVHAQVDGTEAHVTVGMEPNPGQFTTAAVIHLARFGAGANAPWEVVGTDPDANFSLSQPAYGSSAASPMTVAGHITGVDENISVRVLQPSTQGPIGQACCVPAGNIDTPWSIQVSFSGGTDPVLTVVAVTGGHVAGFERFVVTAVRTGH